MLSRTFFFFTLIVLFGACSNQETDVVQSLDEQIQTINSKCPVQIDSETRLDRVQLLQGPSLNYFYTLTKIKAVKDTLGFKNALWPGLLAGVRTDANMTPLKAANFSFVYTYRSAENKYLFSVSISPADYQKP